MKKFFLSLLVSGMILPVFAEGYQVNVLSTKQTGMGHVGTGMKLGAESMHFNPAGLVFMDNAFDFRPEYRPLWLMPNIRRGIIPRKPTIR